MERARRFANAAPNYDESEYWERRFARYAEAIDSGKAAHDQDGVEWLGDGQILAKMLEREFHENPANDTSSSVVLHLGAGVSNLTLAIGEVLISRSLPLHCLINVDFSQSALKVAQQRAQKWQHELFIESTSEMQFHQADLREWSELHSAVNRRRLTYIIDKSTCDSLATAEDILVENLPEFVQQNVDSDVNEILAIDLVAFYLAALCKADGVWLSMSYSMNRFDFLQNENSISARFWKITDRQAIEAPSGSKQANAPAIYHYAFRIQRTNCTLDLPER